MSVFMGQRLTLVNGIVLSLLFRQHTTIGFGTLVVGASVVNTAQPRTVGSTEGECAIREAGIVVKFSWTSKSREPEAKFVKYARNNAKETAAREKFLRNILQIEDCPLSKVVLRLSKDKDLGELCDCPETLLSIKDAVVLKRTILEIIECKCLRRQLILSHISFS